MAALIPVSPPAVEPVSLSELKEFARVDAGDSSQDGVLAALGVAARAWVEAYLKRKLVLQTWRMLVDVFPGYYAMVTGQPGSSPVLSGPALLAGIRYAIVLPFPPTNAVIAFKYQDANGGEVTMNPATDFIQDLQSNPSRLTPPFGQMWPVARVVLNAVQVDFSVGYAMPITVSLAVNSPPNSYEIDAGSSYQFQASDIGRPISIQQAGLNQSTLNTVVTAITSPPSSRATLREPMAAVENMPALLVNSPSANPAHWEMIKAAIKMLVERWYETRVPDDNNIPMQVKAVLYPARDLRF